MPTPRRYANPAQRQAAYRERLAEARKQELQAKGIPPMPAIPTMPGSRRWDAMNQQALRSLARFDRLWAKFFRGHPFEKDDKDVTDADLAKYHVVLFGDPGSNKWIAKLNGKLPVKWTRDSVAIGAQWSGLAYPAGILQRRRRAAD